MYRPTTEDILRRARFHIRRLRFAEMCQAPGYNPLTALQYLQSQVSQFVNHTDEEESKSFRDISSCLFRWSPACRGSTATNADGESSSNISLPQVNGELDVLKCYRLMQFTDKCTNSYTNMVSESYLIRTQIYESLLEYFPDYMREPKENLVDLVPMS